MKRKPHKGLDLETNGILVALTTKMGDASLHLLKPSSTSSLHTHLTKGSHVEVSTDEEGFKGVYFLATVLKPPSSTTSLLPNNLKKTPLSYRQSNKHLVYVQYHNLLHKNGTSPLREYVHFSFVRPLPPTSENPNFEIGDIVDAYYLDGWWTGVVTAVLDKSRFVITFSNPPDIVDFDSSQLRVHLEWRDGKWVRPEKQRTAGLMFSVGKKVEVSFEKEDYRDAWFPATVLEDRENGSFLVEYQRQGVNANEAVLHKSTVDYLHIRPSPPHLRDRSFELLEKVDAFNDFGWWSGVITKELPDRRYIVFFKHTNKEKELNHLELRPHMDWKDGKWFSSTQGKRVRGGESSNQLIAPAKKPGEALQSPNSGVEGTVDVSAEDIVNVSMVVGLESNVVKNARAKRSHNLASPKFILKETNGQKEQLADSQTPTSVKDKVNNSEGDTVSTQKRKRGRPPRFLSESPITAVNKQNGVVSPNPVPKEASLPTSLGSQSVEKDVPVPDEERLRLAENSTPKQKNTLSTVLRITFPKKDKRLEEKTAQASAEQPQKQSLVKGKRGRRRTISVNTDSSNQDSQGLSSENLGESSEKDGPSRKDNMAVDVLPSFMSDDQPLSAWIGGKISPSTVDLSERKHMEASDRATTTVVSDIQSLPFVKNTPLWETIGSMEVFRMIPQKPHFRPLDGIKESLREGLAIGSMVTFTSLVEKTCGLHFHEPRSTIEDYLETLVELESHGFNVKVVRDRLMTLLDYKDRHDELQEKSTGIRSKIEEKSAETSKVVEEIEEIERKIMELEERRSLAMSKKEVKKTELKSLENEVEGINEGLSGIKTDFDSLASTPLWGG